MLKPTLKRDEILRGKGAFNNIFNKGITIEGHLLRAHVLFQPLRNPQDRNTVRVGFAISKTVRTAVRRNRIRRLLRECYRLNKHIITPQQDSTSAKRDIIFFYSPKTTPTHRMPMFHELEQDMKSILNSLSTQEKK